MCAGLTGVVRALDAMPHVWNHAGGEERFATVVPIQPPLIAHAFGPAFEYFPGGMVAPDPRIDRHPLLIRGAGPAHARVGEDALSPI